MRAAQSFAAAAVGQSGAGEGGHYEGHVPVFPSGQPPVSVVLEPYPNSRVYSSCVAGGLLVTAHRNGIRLFRQRHHCAKGDSASDIRTGLWELVDTRGDFYLRDAYLCASAEQVFCFERVLPVKWNCYVAAACGSDRTRFSVCVLSTAARFLLHHELHGQNKIAALDFGLIPMESGPRSRRFQPFVVSIDEVGEVVIYDVEKDCAVKLRESEGLAVAREGRAGESLSSCSSVHSHAAESPSRLPVYRLEGGLASRISLVGPCEALCKRCGNETVSSSGMVMNLFVASHAHGAEGQAEFYIQNLRFFWGHSPTRAIVLADKPIVRESAREGVCELGVAMLRVPFDRSLPTRFMIARPRLRFWSLSGCTGELLCLHRVYRDTAGGGKGARSARECFVRIAPLGRHVLAHDRRASWLCCAALADDGAVLLLGRAPAPAGRALAVGNKDRGGGEGCGGERTASRGRVCEHSAAVEERRVLEAWLDDAAAQTNEPKSTGDDSKDTESAFVSANRGTVVPDGGASPRPLSSSDSKEDFAVLVVLAAPRNGGYTSARDLLFLPESCELLLFSPSMETFFSIGLPFIRPPVTPPLRPAPAPLAAVSRVWGGWRGTVEDFGIARPLLTAVLGLAGGREAEASAFSRADPQPSGEPASVTSDSQELLRSQAASVTHVHVSDAGDVVSSPRRRFPRRRRRASSVASVEDRRNSIGRSDNEFDTEDARRAYVEGEQKKLLEARQRHIAEEIGFACASAVAQLIEREEPLQRNTITYTWSDEHDALYVRHIQEMLDISGPVQRAERGFTANRTTNEGSVCYRIVMDEVNSGCQSAGFMQAFRLERWRHQDLPRQDDVFDFSAYFSDGVVPRHILELQEDDRCRFELADLRAAYEDDMRQLTETDTVVVYQNEERFCENDKRRRWTPHNTFPFDNASGEVIDMVALNATAAVPSEARAVCGWRWASDARVTSKVVRKELDAWEIGEWQYAERWPTREEEVNGSFHWAEKAHAKAKVRRRRVTRVRVNIAVEAAMGARRQEYEREEKRLRTELGL